MLDVVTNGRWFAIRCLREKYDSKYGSRKPRRIRDSRLVAITTHMHHINLENRAPLEVTLIPLRRNPRRDDTRLGRLNKRSKNVYLASTVACERAIRARLEV